MNTLNLKQDEFFYDRAHKCKCYGGVRDEEKTWMGQVKGCEV